MVFNHSTLTNMKNLINFEPGVTGRAMQTLCKVLSLLIVLCPFINVQAQHTSSGVSVLYDEIFIANATDPNGIRHVQKLLTIGHEGLSYIPLDSAKSRAGSVFKKFNSDSIFSIEKNHYARGVLYIHEKAKSPVWTLVEGDTVIGGYACKKALTTTRGRSYTVWYSPQVPLPYGPWKLYGLPGLVLYVKDSTGEIEVKLSRVMVNNGVQAFARPLASKHIQYIALSEYEPIIAANYKNAMVVAETNATNSTALMQLRQGKGSASFYRKIIEFEFNPKLNYTIQYK